MVDSMVRIKQNSDIFVTGFEVYNLYYRWYRNYDSIIKNRYACQQNSSASYLRAETSWWMEVIADRRPSMSYEASTNYCSSAQLKIS